MTADEHGYNAYSHGCRCSVCRAAKADYMREKRRAARRYAGPGVTARGRYVAPIENHGTTAGYVEHKCRCPECTAVEAAREQRRTRNRVAA